MSAKLELQRIARLLIMPLGEDKELHELHIFLRNELCQIHELLPPV